MNCTVDIFEITAEGEIRAELKDTRINNDVALYTFCFSWTQADADKDSGVKIRWKVPMVGIQYYWSPLCKHNRSIKPNWNEEQSSMISHNAPVQALYDGEGMNRCTWQLSECQKLIFFHSGVMEENGHVECRFHFGVRQYTNEYQTEITLRIDRTRLPLYEALRRAAAWWAEDLGMTPAYVPDAAKDPCYSFWYSYHQEVPEEAVEAECVRARALGFDTCIIDDGWQTPDADRTYARCGDWDPAPNKVSDMKAHIERVHEIGMKYILWYAVPLLGVRSRHYETFKDMCLNDSLMWLGAKVLDPRYKEVREFLKGIYLKALQEWKLDGFKLDFIDTWRYLPQNAPFDPRMDIPSLENAACVFMQELNAALKAVKPDILLEFRQGYIGPWMRTFGNMFRVGDCPDDYISNRVASLDLRAMMEGSAVHSDMLMWHPDEKPEIAALQMASVLFCVMQYSARLDSLTSEMRAMSLHYLEFMRTHRETLLDSELRTYEPHLLYTWAQAIGEKETIAAVYAADKCIAPEMRDTVYIVNGAACGRVLFEANGRYAITVTDCFGNTISEDIKNLCGIHAAACPAGGMVKLTRSI